MTNFEKIISEITIEKIARSRIKSEYPLDCGYRTSNGEKYYYYEDALKAEIEWLQQEVDNVD
jgi:hypothetical protein